MGLTRACSYILQSPKYVSEVIRSNPEFHKECEEALKFSAKALLVISNTYLEKRQFEKWRTNNKFVKDFKTRLILWASYGQAEEMDDKYIIRAWLKIKDIPELATALGKTEDEFLDYVFARKSLMAYFSDQSVI